MDEDGGTRRRLRAWAHPGRYVRDLAKRSPSRVAVAIFVLAGLGFAALLMLPVSSADRAKRSRSRCGVRRGVGGTVTGLTTVDTATYSAPFGQVVILVAIQAGGLGIVTIALLLMRAVTRHFGVREKLFAQQSIGTAGLGEVGELLRIVVLTTLAMEGVLVLAPIPRFVMLEEH